MADISAKDVAALRKITGAGMMDCKKALLENDGDIERAKDWLREKGIAGAAKRSGPRGRPGCDRGARRPATSPRSSSSTARPTSSPRATASASRSRRSTKLVVDEGDTDLGAKTINGETVDDFVKGLVRHARREDRARPRRPLRDDRRSARRLQAHPERARHGRRARRARRRRPRRREGPRGRARHRAAHRERRAPLRHPRRRARPTRSTRERDDLRGADPRRGQARAGVAQDHRGQAQRLLQDRSRSSSSRSSRTRSRRSTRS